MSSSTKLLLEVYAFMSTSDCNNDGSAGADDSTNCSKVSQLHTGEESQGVEDRSEGQSSTETDVLGAVTFEVIEKGVENGRKVSRRGIYLLPNLFTTGALFSGFYAIIAGLNGFFEAACLAVFAAIFLDGLDGRVARLTNTQSAFGAEYDSLSDLVAFGVAPALLMYNWSVMAADKFGWVSAFFYLACTALRLARFNVQSESIGKRFFVGLPSPAAAGLIASYVWVGFDMSWDGKASAYAAGLFMLTVGALMVCNVRFYSFKEVDFRGRVPFAMILGAVFILAVVLLDPPKVILFGLLLYALSGLMISAQRTYRKKMRKK